ncbi:alpha/beta hydrolase [Tropicimonas isoalkanivorans]|uniref:Alpha/beta hydrolase family protein n=1 Tax=Tropicimonas isoalkanivorans TaxID=441112 RepID=A0A1I1NLH9_9RHOB|nr:alpha/beta hydrolase [Tropicimonas isoalkanivorans]SFC98276.1 Alpha/beta hydrolase of unknown function [Tropicimonas isoalkanivorans]
MPLCLINTLGDGLADPRTAQADLQTALDATAEGAPVIVLIHGYKFSPETEHTSPHTHILSLSPVSACWKVLSWPRALGLGRGHPDEPLCIAIGWEARGSLWQAYARAAETGRALAALIAMVRAARPGRPVDVLAHSLGCRVALCALPHLPAGAMGRAVLMAAADMRSTALQCLDTPAGRTVEVLNVTTRANRVFDRALEWLIAPHRIGERALGAGLGRRIHGWIDVDIDAPRTRHLLARLGYPVGAAERRICHWSVYLRPGIFSVYRAVLDRSLPLAALRTPAAEAPTRTVWARIAQTLTRARPMGSRQAS